MSSKVKLSRIHTRVKIQTLAKEGYTVTEIAEKLKVSRTTAQKWKNMKSVMDKRRSGRPKALSSADKRQIKNKMYRKMGSFLRKTTKMLNLSKRNLERGKKVSHMTVHNYLKTTDWGRRAFKSTVRPRLSERNIKDRLSFGAAVEESRYLTSGPRETNPGQTYSLSNRTSLGMAQAQLSIGNYTLPRNKYLLYDCATPLSLLLLLIYFYQV